MKIECPNCGRTGTLPDGQAVPAKVGCPGCKHVFAPAPITAERRPPADTLPGGRPRIEGGLVRKEDGPRAPATPRSPRPIEVVASVPARTCDYCGEPIQPTARKCRHCGEILDPALRAAEEAKRIALRSAGTPPIVVSNNLAATSSAAASAVAGGMHSRWGARLARLVVVAAILVVLGIVLAAVSPESGGPQMVIGAILFGLGGLLLIVGVPALCISGLWRAIFG